ncbi:MAG: NAD(P)/FAD-dependent oxidoreductase, partial [Candidatus Dormibacteraceae bacterium]
MAELIADRDKILRAFELAGAEKDPSLHRALLAFVLVGASPAGVEMGRAIAVLAGNTLWPEFSLIDAVLARIVLVDMAAGALQPFSQAPST